MNRVYSTKQGDMWDSIAYSQLGSAVYTDKLMDLNREYLGVYVFPAGIILTLPDTAASAPASIPPWKKVNG